MGLAMDPVAVAVEPADESIYHSARTRIVRRRMDGRTVLLKEPRGQGAVRRLQHEHAILTRLAGVAGVQQLALPEPQDGALVMIDSGGGSLAMMAAGAMGVDALVDLAHGVGAVLAALHQRGVVHRDVNPNNILLPRPGGRPVLIDFDLATVSAQERMGFTATGVISGTLEYIAPEQTGRTGWPVDHRVDLYSLGATLYELATGAPPFGRGGDALQLVRRHLVDRPRPAAEVNPQIPAALSAIICRLLEKEPDKRYQSAEGLVHDLARLRERLAVGHGEAFPLGDRDFPIRLAPAAQPVGRDAELAALTSAFAATATSGRAVLVTGPPGVGKTSVIDQLRMAVTTRGGWYVSGKFDEHRRDRAADGVWRAMRALGRLLLAEPDAELAACRDRLRERLGPNAGLVAAAVPELATLLGEAPADTGGMDDVESRLIQAAADVLATVAAPDRPLVLFVDDLQWAGATAVGVLDAVITARPAGVLLVGAYRDGEVDAMHPLTGKLSRWERDGLLLPALRLANLPVADVQALLAGMLRLTPEAARTLAEAVGGRAKGNPFDTIELVNALRRDGVLAATDTGWEWDVVKIRSFVGATDVIEMLTARIAELPERSRELLEVAACLGDRIDSALLSTATGWSHLEIVDRCGPILGDGLLVLETGGDGQAVAFRHDRVREAALTSARGGRAARHLTLARRFADHPELWSLTAEQYLTAQAEIVDPAERRRAAGLFHAAAEAARLTDPSVAERYLAAAERMLTGAGDPEAAGLRFAVRSDHHIVLCGLSRFDEADRVYEQVLRDEPDILELAALSRVRITGLRTRNRKPEALALGLDLLARLGARVPTEQTLHAAIDAGLVALSEWVSTGDAEDDLGRPEVTDPVLVAAARVIDQILPVAYFSGNPIFAWLVAESQRMWAEHGPCADLVPPLAHAGYMTVMLRQDYRTGYLAARRVLAVSEARGYEPQTSHARFLLSLGQGPWHEPAEGQLAIARQSREGLLQHGDLTSIYTFVASLPLFLDCAPTLAAFSGEAEAASATADRATDKVAGPAYLAFRQLARALRGDTAALGDMSDESVDVGSLLAGQENNPMARVDWHICRALMGLISNDTAALIEHSAAAMPLLPFINATYKTSHARLVRALGLIEEIRAAEPDDRAALRAALDELHAWWVARAADAQENFGHLLHLITAETHRLDGSHWLAAAEFDAAMDAVARQARPWHAALITERAARFYLDSGVDHVGWSLLAQARDRWYEWGAAGKVSQLNHAYPHLATTHAAADQGGSGSSMTVASTTLDLMAVLGAAQAISSATNLDSLQERLIDVLGAMTGATGIRLLMWDEGAREWGLRTADHPDAPPVLLNDPAAAGQVPLSVIRYVQRTESSLLVADAAQDDRFARDPYLAGMDGYSVMVTPVRSRGALQALLLLEKPNERGAFTAEGMDGVTLVAGQLAVSIDNAMVYSSLERKVNERTEALAAANRRLEELNRTDALTGLANRRRMEEALANEWAQARATGTPVGVVMIDIDHFKQYNDHFGHLGGDRCLRTVADALMAGTRGADLVARYGGEEFCIVVPGADAEATARIAERARLAVASLQEEHTKSPIGFVTVSLGVASTVPTDDHTVDDLVRWADEGLYEAKRDGRNRVGITTR